MSCEKIEKGTNQLLKLAAEAVALSEQTDKEFLNKKEGKHVYCL